MTRLKRPSPRNPKLPRAKTSAPIRRLQRVLFLAALGGGSLLPRVVAQSIVVTGTVSPGTPDSPSSWVIPGSLTIGRNAPGTMAVSGGAIVASNSGLIGDDTNLLNNGNGSATIDGAGSAWNIAQQLTVGQWVTGGLLVSNGGTVTGRTAAVGAGAGSNGTITVTGAGSSLALSGGSPSQLIVGNSGVGTLNVLAGGAVSSAYVSAGQSMSSTGSGTISVSGAGSQLTATTLLNVGDGSNGSLTIEAGGAVVSASAYVGGVPGNSPTAGTGTVLVGGAGSTWTVANQLYVGLYRGASLRIEDQAAVTSGQGIIGLYNNAAPATVEVLDGGAWTSTGYIGVGYESQATLTVSGGGVVTTPTVQLGSIATGSGELILAGNAEEGIGTLETSSVEKGVGAGAVRFDGGRLRAIAGTNTNLLSGVTVQIDAGGALIETTFQTKFVTSELTGVGGLTVEGFGALYLIGNHTYLGVTEVSTGLLFATGNLSSSEVIVQAGGIFGASGLDGDLTIQNGGQLYFDGVTTLDVLGSVNIDASFGVDDLFGLDQSTASGTYSLITSATTDFSLLGLENWGIENARTLGDGRLVYFQGSDLEVVITSAIPEPASAAVLFGLGVLGVAASRRRRGPRTDGPSATN